MNDTESERAHDLMRIQRDLAVTLGSTGDIAEALTQVLKAACQVEGVDCGGVYLVDERTGAVDLAAHCGLTTAFVAAATHYDAEAPQARLVMSGKTIAGRYTQVAGGLASIDHVRQAENLRALVTIPVLHENRAIAALHLASHTQDALPAYSLARLEAIAAQIGGMLARTRAEAALRESQQNLQTLFDTLEDFLFVLDLDGRMLSVNAATEKRLGYSASELRGAHILALHAPDRRAEAAQTLAELFTGTTGVCHAPLMAAGGTLIAVETRLVRGTWSGQAALFGVSRDVTDRQRAEQTVARRAAELAALQATVLDITAPHTLGTLLHTIVERAAGLLNTPSGGMYLCEPDRHIVRCVVSYNTLRDYTGTALRYGEGMAGHVAESGEPLIVDDYRHWGGRAAVYEEDKPFVAVLSVPIRWQGQVTGVINVLDSTKMRQFSQADQELLCLFASHAAIALENTRLYEHARQEIIERGRAEAAVRAARDGLERRVEERTAELAQANAALRLVSAVALAGAAGRPFDEIVARAAQGLAQLWPDAHVSFLFVDETHQALRVHSSYHGTEPELAAGLRIAPGQGVTGWVAQAQLPLNVGDVAAEPRYLGLFPGIRSEMAAPLAVGDRAIGVVDVESPQPDTFSADDLQLLVTLAGQLATIFEKARLDEALDAERASLAQRVEERTAELRAANEQLRQAHVDVSRALEKELELGELKTRFISTASHEFRTPLATILSSAELLEHYGHKWSEDKKLEHLQRIQTATQNMTALLDDVLLVGKAEAGKLEFAPAPLDLERFCRDMVEELQLGQGAGHVLLLTVRGDATQVLMDEQLLRHILGNLLSNAIKYSPRGSEVRCELTCEASRAIFVIQDQGIGIPPADQAYVFEPFHRAGSIQGIPGTGLGLTIVKRSVDLHGGSIVVKSTLGEGTTVTVTLPSGLRPDG